MALTYNGTRPATITYNGAEVKTVVYNGVVVWAKGSASSTYNGTEAGGVAGQVWVKCGSGVTSNSDSITITKPSVPAGATINSATLSFKQGHSGSGSTISGISIYIGSSVDASKRVYYSSTSDLFIGDAGIETAPLHTIDITSYFSSLTHLTFRLQRISNSSQCNIVFQPVTISVNYTV